MLATRKDEPPQKGRPHIFAKCRDQIGTLRRVHEMKRDGRALCQNLPVREHQGRDLRERVYGPQPLARLGRFKKIVQVLYLVGKAVPGELRLKPALTPSLGVRRVCTCRDHSIAKARPIALGA